MKFNWDAWSVGNGSCLFGLQIVVGRDGNGWRGVRVLGQFLNWRLTSSVYL